MFSNLKGKLQFMQDGISAGLRNLKTKEDKSSSSSSLSSPVVDYDVGQEIVLKKESQWNELKSIAEQNYQKAQDIDEQITQIRHHVFKRWSEVKELNQFISSVPEFMAVMNSVACNLAMLQDLAIEIEDSLDSIEDLVERQELQRRELEEKFQFANYLDKKTAETEELKAKLQEEHMSRVADHEKREQETLRERQQLCDIAFQQDLQLYKESGILPMIRRNPETTVTLEDIQIEDDMKDLNELLED